MFHNVEALRKNKAIRSHFAPPNDRADAKPMAILNRFFAAFSRNSTTIFNLNSSSHPPQLVRMTPGHSLMTALTTEPKDVVIRPCHDLGIISVMTRRGKMQDMQSPWFSLTDCSDSGNLRSRFKAAKRYRVCITTESGLFHYRIHNP